MTPCLSMLPVGSDVFLRDLLGKANYLNNPKRGLVTFFFANTSLSCAPPAAGGVELNSVQQQRQELSEFASLW